MSISMNQIPAIIRVPLFYAEFDSSQAVAGSSAQEYKTLLMGNKLAAGTKAALSISRITSPEQAKAFFGVGSTLAEQCEAFLQTNKITPLFAMPLADDGAGAVSTATVTFAGTITEAGTASFMVGGRKIVFGVASGALASANATAFAAAVNADTSNPFSAAVGGGGSEHVVTLSSKNKGAYTLELDVRSNYFDGDVFPAGMTAAIGTITGGSGNPSVQPALDALADEQFMLVSSPYTDTSNMLATETELSGRFDALSGNEGFGIYGKRGNFAALTTYGSGRNSQFSTVMGIRGPSSPWVWAAQVAGQVAIAAQADPARPFQTLVLNKIYAPTRSELFTLQERNQLLQSGIATFMVNSGVVAIEGLITTYQKNGLGAPDTAYLYLNTPLTLSKLRFDWKNRILLKFPRHKLANDGTRFGPGQAVVTPKTMKAEFMALAREWETKALIENVDLLKESIVFERNADDANRLDGLVDPNLVNQLIVSANRIAFRV